MKNTFIPNRLRIPEWQFFDKFKDGRTILLRMYDSLRINRHRLIDGDASTFDPIWNKYSFIQELSRVVH